MMMSDRKPDEEVELVVQVGNKFISSYCEDENKLSIERSRITEQS